MAIPAAARFSRKTPLSNDVFIGDMTLARALVQTILSAAEAEFLLGSTAAAICSVAALWHRQTGKKVSQQTDGAAQLSSYRSRQLSTRAVEEDGAFVINGRKLWITNANEADLFIVFATISPDSGYKGITAFVVERTFPGFAVGKKEDKLGIRASSTCELLLDGCRVPKANVLGEVGRGYRVAIETLNEGRIGISGSVLFALGSDQLRPEGRQLLRSLVHPLRVYLGERNELLMVSGFTDDTPVQQGSRRYEDNLVLLFQRCQGGDGISPADIRGTYPRPSED